MAGWFRLLLRWLWRTFAFLLAAFVGLTAFLRVSPWTGGEPKTHECKYNLKAIATAEMAFFAEHDRYTTHLNEAGFDPDCGNRYSYFISRSGPVQHRTTKESPFGTAFDSDHSFYRGVETDALKYPSRVTRVEDLPASIRGEPIGLSGTCPHCNFVAICGAQLDEDPALDVWSVSSRARMGPHGENIPAGQPFHEIDDAVEKALPAPVPSLPANDD